MVRRNKLALGIGGSLGLLLILLILGTVLLPKLSNLPPIRNKILAAVSKQFGGPVSSQRTELSLMSGPQVIIYQGDLQLTGQLHMTFRSLAIHIEILPLFMGQVRTSELELRGPNLSLPLPPRSVTGQHPKRVFSLAAVKSKVPALLAALAKKAPGLEILVEKGVLALHEEDGTLFQFRDLSARIHLPPTRFQVAISGESNICQKFALEAWLQPGSDSGQGQLHCQGLQPAGITAYLVPRAPLQVLQGLVNLDLTFRTNALKSLQIALNGSIPTLKLHKNKTQLVLKAKDFAATVALDQTRLRASVAHLDLDSPQLQSSGVFEWRWAPQDLELKVQGKAIDVAATRRAALFLMGEHSLVRKIFNIVRGGEVPVISFTSHGDSLHHLGKKENFVLKGTLAHGEIFVPKVNLDLKDVCGETIIANGILAGKDLCARLGNSTGDHGILRLGLEKHHAPLHLDIMIDADLAQLPPLLERLVKNQKFVKEVKLIKHATGSARGRLILGENVDHIRVHTDVSRFDLHADYARVPYPMSVKGGHILYGPHHIAAQNLQVSAGDSSFSQLSFMIDWLKTAQLQVQARKARISLQQFYSWLLSFKEVRRDLKDFQNMAGTAQVNDLRIQGPLAHPRSWKYSTSGTFRDYHLRASFLPGRLTLKQGAFQWQTKKLTLADARGTILDAALHVSGSLEGYLYDLQGANLNFSGKVGPQALGWLEQFTHLPASLNMRPPLSVSGSHLIWAKQRTVKFTGNFAVPNGPQVALDLARTPSQLIIHKLSLQDQTSHATMTLSLNKTAFEVSFNGNLTHTTLDRLLVSNQLLEGWLKGNFRAHILLDKPMDSVAQGVLQGAGVEYPRKEQIPVQLEQFSCQAAHHKLTVKAATLSWNGRQMTLQGEIKFSPQGFVFDMGLSAASFDWDEIQQALARKDWSGGSGQQQTFWSLPVHGTLRVDVKRFTYHDRTWSPCHADIFWGTNQLNVVITKADLCGIATPGTIQITPDQVQIDITPTAQNGRVNSAMSCLFNKARLMNGHFDLRSEFKARGKPQQLMESLAGNLHFVARKGRIFRFNILAKIFTVLNFTDIFIGRLPDLTKEGLGYRSITLKGDIRQGKLKLREAVIDGDSIEIVSQGTVDLTHKTLNLTVLVAPLKTIDIMLKYIPLLGDIIGKIVSIPVQVTGSLNDPTVIPLSPAAVGSELLGIMKGTLGLPFKIIQPILPK